MRKGKFILLGLLCAMLGIIVYAGFFRKIDSPVKKENVLTAGEKEQSKPSIPEDFDGQDAHWDQYGQNLPCAKNTLTMGQEFEMDGLAFVVNGFEMTKEAVDSDVSYHIEETDEVQVDNEGNILNGFTYMIANVTITNKSMAEKEFWFSGFQYVPIEPETGQTAEQYDTGRVRGYKARNDTSTYEKSYYRQVFMPGQQYTGNLVFIQYDEGIAADKPYLLLNPTGGLYVMDDEVKFVKLTR